MKLIILPPKSKYQLHNLLTITCSFLYQIYPVHIGSLHYLPLMAKHFYIVKDEVGNIFHKHPFFAAWLHSLRHNGQITLCILRKVYRDIPHSYLFNFSLWKPFKISGGHMTVICRNILKAESLKLRGALIYRTALPGLDKLCLDRKSVG